MPPEAQTSSGMSGTGAGVGGINTYDPTSSTPYTPPPEASTVLPPAVTAPPPRTDDKPVQSPATLLPHSKSSTIATIATLGNAILKGAMQGRDKADQMKAYKANRLMQGLQANYQTAATNYLGMLKNGADPNSKEVQEAKNQRDAAWQAMRQMQGSYLFPGSDKEKKGKKKSSGDQDQQSPMAILTDPKSQPIDKLKAWWMVTEKMGPPDEWQAQQFMTPEYRKNLELGRGEQRIAGDIQGKRIELHDLQNMDPSKLDDKQKARLEQLRTDPELFPKMATADKKIGEYIGKDNKKHIIWQKPGGETEDRIEGESEVREYASLIPKLGTSAAFMDQWAKENGVDPKNIPSATQQQLEQVWKEALSTGATVTVANRQVLWTDIDGHTWKIPVTTTTTRTPTAMPKPPMPGATIMPGAGTETGAGAGTGAGTGTGSGAAKPAESPKPSKPPQPPMPGATLVGTGKKPAEETTADINAQNAMKDVMPIIDELIGELEPHKGQKGALDSVGSHLKWYAYKAGMGSDPESDKLKQLIGFVSIAGAAPWSKIGRGKYIFEQAQAHLPQPTDSPGLAYNKLKELKSIYQGQLKQADIRLGRSTESGAGGAGGKKSATMQNIRDYAAKKGISEDKAKQEFTDAGYEVQEGQK